MAYVLEVVTHHLGSVAIFACSLLAFSWVSSYFGTHRM